MVALRNKQKGVSHYTTAKTSHKINTASKNAVLKRLTAYLPFSKSGGRIKLKHLFCFRAHDKEYIRSKHWIRKYLTKLKQTNDAGFFNIYLTLVHLLFEHDGKPAQGFGLIYQGRLVCFYNFETDLGDGWDDVHNDPKELRTKALQMGANIVQFVFGQ
ncbi:MAG: DUF4159 domain-containing protein [Saprospiraceae bacterium]|nr:DUF4159 domain-containing protein [Saprospiraceae bacterium]